MELTTIGAPIVQPLQAMWLGVVSAVLPLIGAILVLLIGWIVANVISKLVSRALEYVKAEKWVLERTNLRKLTGSLDLVAVVGLVTKWFVFVPFIASAATVVNMQPLSQFLTVLALWIPNAITAVVVALFGFVAADYLSGKIEDTKMRNAKSVATAAQWLVLIIVSLIVLEQVGLKVEVIKDSFNIILAGIMLAFAIAVGIGFGDALKGEAAKTVKSLKR